MLESIKHWRTACIIAYELDGNVGIIKIMRNDCRTIL